VDREASVVITGDQVKYAKRDPDLLPAAAEHSTPTSQRRQS
jgi:hypothetical protein